MKRLFDSIKQSKYSKSCICHSDLHAGNIVFNKQVNFIDFEYSTVYFNYYDVVCFMAEFCGIECDLARYPEIETKKILLK